MSVDDTSAILCQDDYYNIYDHSVYRLTFTKGSVVCIYNNYDN